MFVEVFPEGEWSEKISSSNICDARSPPPETIQFRCLAKIVLGSKTIEKASSCYSTRGNSDSFAVDVRFVSWVEVRWEVGGNEMTWSDWIIRAFPSVNRYRAAVIAWGERFANSGINKRSMRQCRDFLSSIHALRPSHARFWFALCLIIVIVIIIKVKSCLSVLPSPSSYQHKQCSTKMFFC